MDYFVLTDAINKQGMKKYYWLLVIYIAVIGRAHSAVELTEEEVNHVAQKIVDFHKTEVPELLTSVLAPDINIIITQGSDGYGFTLHFNKNEYLDYLIKGHKSRTRIGTDVSYVSSEFLGDKEAKIIIRYRSKELRKYVWVEGIVSVVNGKISITQLEEFN